MTKSAIHRNYAFELYRLLFACAIFIMHMEEYRNYDPPKGMFSGGYLGVEFFFILSGFLMMAKNDHDRTAAVQEGAGEKLAARYLLSRYQRLMPHYWLAIGLHLLICVLLWPQFDLKKTLLRGFNDILALQTFWRPGNIDSVYWFVSALLWASALVYYLLLKKRDFCIYVGFPLGLLIFMGWLYRGYGGIAVYNDDKFFMGTFWRAGGYHRVECGISYKVAEPQSICWLRGDQLRALFKSQNFPVDCISISWLAVLAGCGGFSFCGHYIFRCGNNAFTVVRKEAENPAY